MGMNDKLKVHDGEVKLLGTKKKKEVGDILLKLFLVTLIEERQLVSDTRKISR